MTVLKKRLPIFRSTNFTCMPVRERRNTLQVRSTNQYGFEIVTEHLYDDGAALERQQRLERGHTEVK